MISPLRSHKRLTKEVELHEAMNKQLTIPCKRYSQLLTCDFIYIYIYILCGQQDQRMRMILVKFNQCHMIWVSILEHLRSLYLPFVASRVTTYPSTFNQTCVVNPLMPSLARARTPGLKLRNNKNVAKIGGQRCAKDMRSCEH